MRLPCPQRTGSAPLDAKKPTAARRRKSSKRPPARPQAGRAKAPRRTERAPHEGDAFARKLADVSADWYWEHDAQSRVTYLSPSILEAIGVDPKTVMGKLRSELRGATPLNCTWEEYNALIEARMPYRELEYRRINDKGEQIYYTVSGVPVFDARRNFLGYRGVGRSITARRRAELALRESEARFRDLTALSSDWYWEQDEDLRFTFLSTETGDQADHGSQSSLGKKRWDLPEVTPESGSWDEHRALVEARKPFRNFYLSRKQPDGSSAYFVVSGAPIYDENGRFKGYRGVGHDVTERRRAEERIRELATHDVLTGLPNRGMFSQLLNAALEAARRYERKVAVLFIDLDGFKYVNDYFGHEVGDELLKQMSRRMKECLRASDLVARLGGDEFVVMLQEAKEPQDAAAAARNILAAASKPLQIFSHECRVSASIGVCLYPADAQDEQSLMKNADLAMYQAKEEGKNNYRFYATDSNSSARRKLDIETHLRSALVKRELSLHYQAKRNLQDGAIAGVEALLRWQNPELGAVAPAQFIPVAEATGLIVPIGQWVLSTACAQNVAWQKACLPAVCMSVNLSARQFADAGLLADLARALDSTGLAPRQLELEISESMVMHDTERALKLLRAIKELGVRIAIADFGVGYLLLAQLKRHSIDTLKVGRGFIREIASDGNGKAIAEAIIAMGKTLSLTVVAEGVETGEQEEFLRGHACDQMQGFYFSKPIPTEQFAELLGSYVPAGGPRPRGPAL